MSTRTYQSLQLCRVIASVLVTLFHLGGAFGAEKYFGDRDLQAWTSWGHYSVVFFFVLSGFIMVRAHHEDVGRPERLLDYVRKRSLRVYPTYLIILFGVYGLARLIPALSNTVPHDFWMMVKAALLVPQDPVTVGGTGAPVLIVAWSMQYEMAFYVLVGCFIGKRWLGLFIVLMLVSNYIACRFESTCSFPRSFFASNFFLPFFFGTIAAWLSLTQYRLREPLRVAAVAVCIICLFRGLDVVVYEIKETLLEDGTLIYALLSSALIVALVDAEDAGRIKVSAAWGPLAGASYALYLLHFPLISLMCKIAMSLHIQGVVAVRLTFIAMFVVCVLAAQLFYAFIERPMVGHLLDRGKTRGKIANGVASYQTTTSPADNGRSSILSGGAAHVSEFTDLSVVSREMADPAAVDVAVGGERSVPVFNR